ncbi:MAG: urease accessory protein UreD [Janthinobacterium lividum]
MKSAQACLPDQTVPCPGFGGATGAVGPAACSARLALAFADDAGTTRLVGNEHFGPLRVQKALYPEAPAVCHAIIVHPPGGVVGGDQLDISATMRANAHVFLTTPGATKWYRANGSISRQAMRFEVGAAAALEWLPQETIFYNGAHVELDSVVDLAPGAQYIGCETLCFGRTASGERFDHGMVAQKLAIRQAGKLVWYEQGVLAGDGVGMDSVLTLGGRTVCATLVAVATVLPAGLLAAMRRQLAAEFGTQTEVGPRAQPARQAPQVNTKEPVPAASSMQFALTQMKTVLVARYLGDSSETARQIMTRTWQLLRPAMLGRDAVVPRIWNT